SVLYGARECDSDMRRTGFIDDRNNSHKLCVSRRAAEPAGPPGDRESATYRDDLCGCRLTLIRRETHDVHEQLIAIGGGKHFGPHNTAVRITDHHGLLNESAQMRRLTRTGRGTIMRIVASERTPIGPECGERESHDQHERHHQACRSPAMSLVHCLPSLKRVVEPPISPYSTHALLLCFTMPSAIATHQFFPCFAGRLCDRSESLACEGSPREPNAGSRTCTPWFGSVFPRRHARVPPTQNASRFR